MSTLRLINLILKLLQFKPSPLSSPAWNWEICLLSVVYVTAPPDTALPMKSEKHRTISTHPFAEPSPSPGIRSLITENDICVLCHNEQKSFRLSAFSLLHKGEQRLPWALEKALALIQKIFENFLISRMRLSLAVESSVMLNCSPRQESKSFF